MRAALTRADAPAEWSGERRWPATHLFLFTRPMEVTLSADLQAKLARMAQARYDASGARPPGYRAGGRLRRLVRARGRQGPGAGRGRRHDHARGSRRTSQQAPWQVNGPRTGCSFRRTPRLQWISNVSPTTSWNAQTGAHGLIRRIYDAPDQAAHVSEPRPPRKARVRGTCPVPVKAVVVNTIRRDVVFVVASCTGCRVAVAASLRQGHCGECSGASRVRFAAPAISTSLP